MRLLNNEHVKPYFLQCSECHSRVPDAVELSHPNQDGSTIKLCGNCIAELWDTYWRNDPNFTEPNKESVENFNTKLNEQINWEDPKDEKAI